MWQKCPICIDGKIPAEGYNTLVVTQPCKVCKGKMILSKLTGLPPDYEANKKFKLNNK